MDDDALLDRLCMERLKRRGYTVIEGKPNGLSLADQIKRRVADYFGIRFSDIAMRTRGFKNVATARQVAMYLTHELTELSYSEIGKDFGRERSTVIWACKIGRRDVRDNTGNAKAILDIRNGLP